jgi:hypothetical protein
MIKQFLYIFCNAVTISGWIAASRLSTTSVSPSLRQTSPNHRYLLPQNGTNGTLDTSTVTHFETKIVNIEQGYLEPVSFVISNNLNISQLKENNVTLYLEFLSQPTYGTLMDTNGTSLYQNESTSIILGPFNQSNVTFLYQLHDLAYFNYPTVNALGENLTLPSETLQYQWTTRDTNQQVVGASFANGSLNVRVHHINHPPILLAPPTAFPNPNVMTKNDSTLILIQGIRVVDTRDLDMEYIRVDVTSKLGKLTLNPQYLHLADFDSCRSRYSYEMSDWNCVGTGHRDRRLTFVVLPSQVEWILQDLQYRSLMPGYPDQVEIRVYDGEGGDCLTTAEHVQRNGTSIHHGCTRVTASVSIPPFLYPIKKQQQQPQQGDTIGQEGVASSSFGVIDFFLFGLILLFSCCFMGVLRKVYHLLARGNAIDADGGWPPMENDDDGWTHARRARSAKK